VKPSWWTIGTKEKHVHELGVYSSGSGDDRRICLLSDVHWDNAHARLDLLKAALDEALENDIPVFMFGDLFCVMQGKWDHRASQDALRPEHRGGNYLDLIVNTALEWFHPYRDILAFVSPGNHEAAIRKRHETDIISRFVGGMRKAGSRVIQGGYWGFIVANLKPGVKRGTQDRRIIHYSHGNGGGAEVTRGLIDHSRTSRHFIADVFVSGHIHRRNCEENIIATISSKNCLSYRQQLFLRSSCWKNEMEDEWHSGLRGRGPRPIGGWWLDFLIDKRGRGGNYQISKLIPVMM
jgi:hypothetical protein